MAHVITSPCIGVKDQSCVNSCPVDCIVSTDEDEQFYIDPNTCIDCGICASACPVGAIYREEDVPEEEESFIDLNKRKSQVLMALR